MGVDRTLSAEAAELDEPRSPSTRDLEITDVQTTVVAESPETYGGFLWTLVRIYTDAGVVGTGEAYHGHGVPELVSAMRPVLVGENPLDIDRLYEHLIEEFALEGSLAGATTAAISGLEIALHDLAGKVHDMPAYQLLGGKYRDKVRAYCDCSHEEGWDPSQFADEAERVVDELGFDAIKFDLDLHSGREKDYANRHLRATEIDHRVEIVEAIIERVGNRADVAFDCHYAFTSDSGRRLAARLEPYDVWWMEDPVPPGNDDVQQSVTASTTTTIATGENVYRKHGERALIEDGGADVLHPDVPKVGGMQETRTISKLAELYSVPLALHNLGSPVATVASAQVGAAIPNFLAVEYHSYEIPWWQDLVEESILSEGRIRVPEAPGLGLTLDRDVVKTHMIDGETLFDPAS